MDAQVGHLGSQIDDFEIAVIEALEPAKRPRIHTFIATSDVHLQYKLKKSRQQVLDEAVAAVEQARRFCHGKSSRARDMASAHPRSIAGEPNAL